MARIRTLKIGFFKNEDLAALSAHHRLCFSGLWLLADKAGRLEDRPRRIKAELFPYEAVDVDVMLTELAGGGFVRRYLADGVRYLQVCEFKKHQRPKSDEPESVIPAHVYDDPRGILTEPRGSSLGREGKGEGEGKGEREPGAVAPPADGAEALRTLWNSTTESPIPRCLELSTKRRRSAKARLTERPLTEWATVFARIQASRFCTGGNDRGWRATFDWAIGSPDVAVKVLEGKYDNGTGASPNHGERPPTLREEEHARNARRAAGRCLHDPTCESYSACLTTIIRHARSKAS